MPVHPDRPFHSTPIIDPGATRPTSAGPRTERRSRRRFLWGGLVTIVRTALSETLGAHSCISPVQSPPPTDHPNI